MKKLWLIFYFIPVLFAQAQSSKPGAVVSDPMPGAVEIGGLYNKGLYEYQFLLNHAKSPATGTFHTQVLWQWRKPATDFNFLTGSCTYFNETIYDHPGKPYGGDLVIFESMAKDSAAFMLWLGDNWYTREEDGKNLNGRSVSEKQLMR